MGGVGAPPQPIASQTRLSGVGGRLCIVNFCCGTCWGKRDALDGERRKERGREAANNTIISALILTKLQNTEKRKRALVLNLRAKRVQFEVTSSIKLALLETA